MAFAIEAYAAAGREGRPVDATIASQDAKASARRAQSVLRMVQAQPFSTGDRIDVPGWIGWGKFTYGSRTVITLLKAWKRTGEQKYRDAAHLAIGPQYGANPLSMSFVTGLGERSPRNPTCEVCLADDVVEPYPGLPIFGVFAHLANSHPFYKIANHDANNFPYIMYTKEDRPVLTRYIDHKQIIPQSEYTISTMSHTLVAIGLLAKRRGRLLVRNATLRPDDGPPTGSLELALEKPYAMPTGSCTWLFDDASLATLGAGASCNSSSSGGGEGVLRLWVRLGSGATVAAGTALRTRGPEVGYTNYETEQWQQTVVVQLAAGRRRSLHTEDEAAWSAATGPMGAGPMGAGPVGAAPVATGAVAAGPVAAGPVAAGPVAGSSWSSRRRRRRLSEDTAAASAASADAAASFGQVAGADTEYDSGVMLTTNSSAPELSVSPLGAAGFDALALGEITNAASAGTQVDFARGAAPDGGLFACPSDCSGRGSCLADIGECVCLQGSSGDACEVSATAAAGPPPTTPPSPSPSTPPPLPPPSPQPPRYPPFTPLREGQSVVNVVASVVTLGITIAGSVESFDDTARTAFATKLQESLRCFKPACLLTLRVAPASVQVTAILTIPDSAPGSAAAAADVAAAATTLAALDTASLSSSLGVTVTAATAPTVQQAVSVPLVVAPPPPPLGPGAGGGGGSTLIITIIIAAAAGIAAGGAVLLVRAVCRRRGFGVKINEVRA